MKKTIITIVISLLVGAGIYGIAHKTDTQKPVVPKERKAVLNVNVIKPQYQEIVERTSP